MHEANAQPHEKQRVTQTSLAAMLVSVGTTLTSAVSHLGQQTTDENIKANRCDIITKPLEQLCATAKDTMPTK